jgi:Ca2+-binding RTX toxin-like protein
VTELAGGGTDDNVASAVSYTLPAEVEVLFFFTDGDFKGTGNAADNHITGFKGNDTLDGKAGADTLDGDIGNDVLIVDDIGDKAVGGIDTDLVLSSVTHTLGFSTENLTLTGSAKIDGTGNDDANVILGNGGANVLAGGLGADTLDGGGGLDTLMGGDGSDRYLFHDLKSGKDAIQGFENGPGGDVLDIGDVLVGFIDGVSDVHDYVQLSVSFGVTIVKVDADGLAGGSKFTDLCTIAFVSPLTATLDTLVADGNIALT